MRELHVYKHAPLTERSDEVEDAVLYIDRDPIPKPDDLKECLRFFEMQGQAIAEFLGHTLPGGTMHALLIELLRRKENLLVIRED